MGQIKHVTAKLGTMKKEVEWVVYPRENADAPLKIQSDKRIAMFDPKTGKGLLSKSCPSGAYNVHLHPSLGATPVLVPQDVIAAALGAEPKNGDQIGPGVYIMTSAAGDKALPESLGG